AHTADDDGAQRGNPAAGEQHLAASTAAELIAVSPGCELRTQRFTDANERGSAGQLRESDVVGGNTLSRVAIELLRLLDRFPSLLERGEVPPLTVGTDDPKPPLCRIERETLPHWEHLERLVGPKWLRAEQTGGVHQGR